MDNQSNNKKKIEKYKKELIESYEKIDELETKLLDEKNKHDELVSENKLSEKNIHDKNSLIIEFEEKLYENKVDYEKEIKHKEKLIDDLKIKVNDNKILLVQKNDLILQLENKKLSLQSDNKKFENQLFLKNTKVNKKDLLIPLLETENNDEILIFKNKIQKLEEKIKELEEENINLEKNLKTFVNKENKEIYVNLYDEIYISEKENKLKIIKSELKKFYEEKKRLEKDIFELKSVVQILKKENGEKNDVYVKKKFCCFM